MRYVVLDSEKSYVKWLVLPFTMVFLVIEGGYTLEAWSPGLGREHGIWG